MVIKMTSVVVKMKLDGFNLDPFILDLSLEC